MPGRACHKGTCSSETLEVYRIMLGVEDGLGFEAGVFSTSGLPGLRPLGFRGVCFCVWFLLTGSPAVTLTIFRVWGFCR